MSGSPPPDETDEALMQSGFRYALSLTHHQQAAEDLVQQAAFKLIRRHGRLKGHALLFRSIRNLWIDEWRRRGDTKLEPLEDEVSGKVLAFVPAPETAAMLDLEHILGELAPEEREVLFLHYVWGYTAREMAELMDCPRNTVLSKLSRARERLAKTNAVQEHRRDSQ